MQWRYWSLRNSSAWPSARERSRPPSSPSGTTTASKSTDGIVSSVPSGSSVSSVGGLDGAEPGRDQPDDRPRLRQRCLRRGHRRRLDAGRHQDGDLASADAAVAGPRGERQRRRRAHLGLRWLHEPRHRLAAARCRAPSATGLRQLVGDVAEHRHRALADRGHLHLGQLEAEAADDVRLLVRGLAVPEERGLRVVVGELLRLAAHLVAGDRLRESCVKPARPRLERAAAAERVGLVGHAAAVDRLAMDAVALVVVRLRERRVDRDLVEVGPAQPRAAACRSTSGCARRAAGRSRSRCRAPGSGRRRRPARSRRRSCRGCGRAPCGPTGVTGTSSSGTILVGVEHVEAELAPPAPR